MVPLFGALPGGGTFATALLVRLVPTACIALLVGWDAGLRSDNPRAWPTAVVLAGLGSVLSAVVVSLLYVVAGRDHPRPDPSGRDGEAPEREI
ncbi:hypothetical protein HUG10_00865 [Halorarum halophilum]|uniref:Uncharacterized protein n=1 Tax=Halorarum halophilum TaxID=2743090 RepID=A0A7D5KDI3_9EURY|nr:hypothetical protein [Halobaculum halophilum]QLG26176.1 hypothetical protein HUG10_00865 [Halobaculum halophilum]